ncbi:MAG: RNA polymerase sigma factor [Clostridia bacterium]|nr:RNA polymerase sigma factor [Clostridia bacterium]MBR0363814.1 RNA polymerase sigma factor [Clostridia bacterium]
MLLLYLEPFDNHTRDQFKQFYDTYIKLAEVIVSKLIPADYPKLKEDCLQDIWVACSECFERILSISEAERSKYVSAIMRNVAIDSFNKNVAQPSSFNTMSEEIIDFIEDRSESLSFLKTIDLMDLNHAMTKLPANMRKALEDYYLYDYSVEEISLNEQVSTHAIYKRIERGLKELRLILEEEGGYFE